MSSTPAERSLRARLAAHESWGRTPSAQRTARTAPGRDALMQRFLTEADGDPARAESLRKAYYSRLALRSAQSRRRAREARENAAILDQAADDADKALGDAGSAA